jgi:hypothetical protein
VGLADPAPAFRLGTAVSGTIRGAELSALSIPVTTLIRRGQDTGVWVIDPKTLTATWRRLDVISTGPAEAVISNGLAAGDVVVTAGANLIREGQIVRLTGTDLQ